MLLDHFNSFAAFQPVDMLVDFPMFEDLPKAVTPAKTRKGGFLPSTLIETDRGFVEARDIQVGDMVYTFDGGAQEVTELHRAVPRLTAMMHVPAGALGNDTDLILPADQKVALDLDAAERLFGLPVVVVKLVALTGYKGIKTAVPEKIARVQIEFDEEELIWSESGMLVLAGDGGEDGAFHELSLSETRQVLASEEGRALAATGMGEEDARHVDAFEDFILPLLAA